MDIVGFIAAIIPITLSPGASFTLAMNSALIHGIPGVARILLGTALGIYTHGILASFGIAGLLARFPALMRVITVLGTGYLLYLALRLILNGWYASRRTSPQRQMTGMGTAYLANVLNIKAILIYITVVPLFAGVTRTPLPLSQSLLNYAILATLHIVILTLWLLFAAQVLIGSSGRFNPLRLQKVIDLGGGTLLLIITLFPLLMA